MSATPGRTPGAMKAIGEMQDVRLPQNERESHEGCPVADAAVDCHHTSISIEKILITVLQIVWRSTVTAGIRPS
jgi:hypothetical protein